MRKLKEKNNPMISGFINMLFDVIKHFLKDFDNMRKVKKIDHISDNFSTLEHLIIRLEDKLEGCRKQIDDLKNKLILVNVINFILLLFIIYKLIS